MSAEENLYQVELRGPGFVVIQQEVTDDGEYCRCTNANTLGSALGGALNMAKTQLDRMSEVLARSVVVVLKESCDSRHMRDAEDKFLMAAQKLCDAWDENDKTIS